MLDTADEIQFNLLTNRTNFQNCDFNTTVINNIHLYTGTQAKIFHYDNFICRIPENPLHKHRVSQINVGISYLRFEVLMAVTLIVVLWVVMLCGLVGSHSKDGGNTFL
jgi:hypothetical protein